MGVLSSAWLAAKRAVGKKPLNIPAADKPAAPAAAPIPNTSDAQDQRQLDAISASRKAFGASQAANAATGNAAVAAHDKALTAHVQAATAARQMGQNDRAAQHEEMARFHAKAVNGPAPTGAKPPPIQAAVRIRSMQQQLGHSAAHAPAAPAAHPPPVPKAPPQPPPIRTGATQQPPAMPSPHPAHTAPAQAPRQSGRALSQAQGKATLAAWQATKRATGDKATSQHHVNAAELHQAAAAASAANGDRITAKAHAKQAAEHEAMAKQAPAPAPPKTFQAGAKGGQFYLTATGRKVYKKTATA